MGFLGIGGKKKPPPDPFADVGRAQELSMKGVEGYGEALKPHLTREIGSALGGLNAIGALRSGGTTVALGDISQNYADTIGAYAKQAAGESIGYGLEASRQRMAYQQQQDAKKAALWKAIGGVLGAGVGFIAAGPHGAVAGSKAGSAVGDFGGGGGGYA